MVWVVRWVVLQIVQGRAQDPRHRYLWRKGSTYGAIALCVLLIAPMWWAGFSDLATFLGLVSAGIAIALRDSIANLFGWTYLVTWRPFTVGDRVQIGDISGDVIDIGLLTITLNEIGNWVQADQSTGRVVYVPNYRVLSQPVSCYTAGLQYLWHEVRVMVTFESDWRKAKGLLTAIAEEQARDVVAEAQDKLDEANKKWLITYSALTPIVYTRVEDSGVVLTVRFLTPPRRRRGAEQALWEAILDAFAEHDDIELAYPTRRLVDHPHGPAAG